MSTQDSNNINSLDESSVAFFEESELALEQLANVILKLEKDPENTTFFDLMFRKIHTIKGGLSPVGGTQHLSFLLHTYESFLAQLKSEHAKIAADSIDFFLFLNDTIKKGLREIKQNETNSETLIEQFNLAIQTLDEFRKQEGSSAGINPFWRKQDLTEQDNHGDDGAWISNQRLDEFMRLSNELIILRNFHQMLLRDESIRTDLESLDKFSNDFNQNLSKITDQLQKQISQSMNISLAKAAYNLPRVARQTAGACQKEVTFETQGFDLELDRKLAKTICDGLVHMIRNSIDHGIETPEARRELGKPSAGLIQAKAWESDGIIKVKVIDDGAGIDIERVTEKALTLNLISEEKLKVSAQSDILKLIFHPGFSTKEEASSVSGRGVGMDVVHAAIQDYRGNISVSSNTGEGTQILLEFPIPRKVMVNRTILCKWENFMLAVPVDDIERIISCEPAKLNYIDNVRFAQFDGITVPLLTCQEIREQKLLVPTEEVRSKSMVVMRGLDRKFALLVDSIDQQLEVVIRPFSPLMKKIKGFKGTAILGDDLIAYVVSADEVSELLSASYQKELGTQLDTDKEAA